jgi:hypothetical protein
MSLNTLIINLIEILKKLDIMISVVDTYDDW